MWSHRAGDYLATHLLNSPHSPNLLQTFPKFPKGSPFSPNVIQVHQRSLKVLERLKFTRLFGDPDIWPQMPKQSLFPPNIHELVANYSPGSLNVRQLLAAVHQVVPQNWKWGTAGEYLMKTVEGFTNVWWQFGEDLANINVRIATFAIYSPNSCQKISPIDRHARNLVKMFAKRSHNNHLFIAKWSQNSLIIIRRFSPFLSQNCR